MGGATVGIVGIAGDDETEALSRSLTTRGAEVCRIDFRGFPELRSGRLGAAGWRYDGVAIGDLDACYLRISGYNWPYPRAAGDPTRWAEAHPGYLQFLEREVACLSYKECFLRELSRRIPVVNPQPLQELHRLKIYQLLLLRRAGIEVPESVASNDPVALSQFAERTGPCVRKPLGGVYKTNAWELTPEVEAELRDRPSLLQDRYPGRTVRCYVVDDRLMASAEILHGGAVDSSIEQRGIQPVTLPEEVQAMVRSAAHTLGLRFSGIDVQHDTERDRYAILECNISPMFANFSRMIGIDIPGAIADLLLRLAKSEGSGPE